MTFTTIHQSWPYSLAQLVLQSNALLTALADDHARLSAVDVNSYARSGSGRIHSTLDLDLGDTSVLQLSLQLSADLVILDEVIAEILLEANQRLSQSLITPTRMPCGFTFWPIVFPPYSFSFRTTVMWLVRFRMR